MERHWGRYLYLFSGLLALFMAFFISQINLKSRNNIPELTTLNENLWVKEQLAKRWLDSLQVSTNQLKLAGFVNQNSKRIDNLFDQYGLVLYVYNNGRLVYWSNNAMHIPADTNWFKTPAQKLGNAFASVQYQRLADKHFVACILIKNQFSYENKFLTNQFHPSFQLNQNYGLVKGKVTPNVITSYNGEVLFSVLPPENSDNETASWVSLWLIILGLLSILLFIQSRFKRIMLKSWQLIMVTALFFGGYAALLKLGLPVSLQQLKLFWPEYFATSYWIPSLGHLLILSLICLYVSFLIYAHLNIKVKNGVDWYRYYALWPFIAFILFYAAVAAYIFRHLVYDSNFQFEAFELLSLSWFSLVSYVILLLWFLGLILVIEKFVRIAGNKQKLRYFYLMFGIVAVLAIILSLLIYGRADIWSFSFVSLVFVLWMAFRVKQRPKFLNVVVLLVVFSVYITYFIRAKTFDKRLSQGRVMAISLARQQDPVAEVVLADFKADIRTDSVVNKLLQNDWLDYNALYNYIEHAYFSGYLKRYSFQLTACNSVDSVWVDSEQEQYHCHSFFRRLVKENGTPTSTDGVYLMQNNTGRVNYFFTAPFKFYNRRFNISLFFELIAKPNYEVLGYPELLLEKPLTTFGQQLTHNFAKYNGTRLLISNGTFPYAFDRLVYGNLESEFGFYRADKYDHIIYNSPNGESVLVSFPSVHWFNVLISFTYIFLFYLLITFLVLLAGNRYFHVVDIQFTIKNKIVLSMILMLTISLILVGGGTVFYSKLQYERDQMRGLSDKTQGVLVEIDRQLSQINNIDQVGQARLDNLLIQLSNVFFTDINIYNLNGKLAGTSRKEIFDRKLTSQQMNAVAYRELLLNKRAKLIQKENIGNLQYYSAYVPFINSNNQLIAYLNLPYFTKETLLGQELLSVMVAVINIYALLMLISIAIAVYISNRLTNPLRQIQARIKNIDISRQNDPIDYQGHDEIADLIVEYNRMSQALAESARLLAKSERESAWREMARQVAHEIKNPLTPMKLNVQMLNKAWDNNDSDFNDRLKRVSQTLIEQIDSLSNIANAFSQFAQMPQSKTERLDLLDPITNCVELFKESAKIKMVWQPPLIPVWVKADYERLLQVFNNLIKNAIQAIPANRIGEIRIEVTTSKEHAIIAISDNGVGVSPQQINKMFVPNFTTKTSGTGLGLAIVKNIVEEFEGNIWFNTRQGRGTTFFISLPLLAD